MTATFTCSLCWANFSTQEDLDQHEHMESAVDYPLDGDRIEPDQQAAAQ